MKKFNNVIVRRPCKAVCDGITSAPELGQPIYEKALKQHDAYIEALKKCGVEVTVLEADEQYPESVMPQVHRMSKMTIAQKNVFLTITICE